MCGIAGLVAVSPHREWRDPLANMHRAIAHRGPDDRGTWQSPSGRAAFVHTRLSILDPSPAGHQPMTVADRFTITYNGEIYNFAELRAALVRSGIVFRSQSDTEVILRLYEAEGPGFVERLRGMFAFAIWDEREQTCLLARDRFGIKPLYYHAEAGTLVFGSEVRALAASGLIQARLDPTAAYAYFRSGSVPEPLTLVAGVRTVEAGHVLVWKGGTLSGRRYWEVHFPEATPVEHPEQLARHALIDSVTHHHVSDVPVGIFLSGGIDSTALVALSRLQRNEDLRTFSLTFPGLPHDEGPEARRTAHEFGTDHHEWPLDGAAARVLFDDFLGAADQPSIDGFNTFAVCRLARSHDTKVVLSGLGGDELFGGYPSFRSVPRLARLGRLARLAGPLGAAAVRAAGWAGGSRLRRLNDLVAAPSSLEAAYAVFRGIFAVAEARALTERFAGRLPEGVPVEPPGGAAPTAADRISQLELTRYLRNQLLRDADVMSMASGVEVRTPFLDAGLFDAVSRIPAAQRLLPGKGLLTQAVPELPDWVTRRPKRGFHLPIQHWLDHDWAGSIALPGAPDGVRLDSWYRRWSVLVFHSWVRRMGIQGV
jgi:asparagine synthase (glutamine-hydrolysing)